MYSEKVLKHFKKPHNVGKIEDADGIGTVGNRACGDVMKLYIKVEDNKIVDIKFETMGCAAAISSSDMLCEMAKGKTIEEALKITKDDLIKELEGLPPVKIHCSVLAVDALHEAIKEYKQKQKK
ncbi:Fe-S cluster assembly scaffold protein NifU [Candidatus Woesearchaeota archaeon]|nr:Fe-S cluster assembly scaffold protein NifU [Candidatus Woesearchaeota archaeon]